VYLAKSLDGAGACSGSFKDQKMDKELYFMELLDAFPEGHY
jgi:hypothetical protein